MARETLKRIDILRHELKALRFILDNLHVGKIGSDAIPPRADFQSEQGRELYDVITKASSRADARNETRGSGRSHDARTKRSSQRAVAAIFA